MFIENNVFFPKHNNSNQVFLFFMVCKSTYFKSKNFHDSGIKADVSDLAIIQSFLDFEEICYNPFDKYWKIKII